jgi:hypothetical protein
MTLRRTGCRAKSKSLDQDHCKLLGRSSTTQRRPDVVSRKARISADGTADAAP